MEVKIISSSLSSFSSLLLFCISLFLSYFSAQQKLSLSLAALDVDDRKIYLKNRAVCNYLDVNYLNGA